MTKKLVGLHFVEIIGFRVTWRSQNQTRNGADISLEIIGNCFAGKLDY